ncbi:hypothetical protein PR048_015657 [Dryococelus australis]|uniref:Uncharacterized protein n=1 Tax=Dryococelus australis TaxID=614101 RepID=A0ABQ9HHJ8_9NEOP|nr:hypothetical protein PR048_015657 [Dryococelus australis]
MKDKGKRSPGPDAPQNPLLPPAVPLCTGQAVSNLKTELRNTEYLAIRRETNTLWVASTSCGRWISSAIDSIVADSTGIGPTLCRQFVFAGDRQSNHNIHGDSSPFLLQPIHELSNGFWPRLTSPHPAIQFVPKMFYRVEIGALGGPVQSANIVFGKLSHSSQPPVTKKCTMPTIKDKCHASYVKMSTPDVLVKLGALLDTSCLRSCKASTLITKHKCELLNEKSTLVEATNDIDFP